MQVIKFIKECSSNIKYIICGKCLEKYKLDNIIRHKHIK